MQHLLIAEPSLCKYRGYSNKQLYKLMLNIKDRSDYYSQKVFLIIADILKERNYI